MFINQIIKKLRRKEMKPIYLAITLRLMAEHCLCCKTAQLWVVA